MRLAILATAAALAIAAFPASATDPALEALLNAAKLPFEVDKDGDYKIVYEWSKDKRSQLVYVSGTTEELPGMKLYKVFSPAKVMDDAGIDPALAKRLLAENAQYKFGGWELAGKTLYFRGNAQAGTPAAQVATRVSVVACSADDMGAESARGQGRR